MNDHVTNGEGHRYQGSMSNGFYVKCWSELHPNIYYRTVKEMVSGGMLNRNEGRNEFDYSPVDNEEMSEYIVLENYIPVAKVGEQEKLVN